MELIKYTVREGNTLFGIAQFFQTTVADILQYNNIQNPAMIYPGQELTFRQALIWQTTILHVRVKHYGVLHKCTVQLLQSLHV